MELFIIKSLKTVSSVYMILLVFSYGNCQKRQFDLSAELPSHLPAPPKGTKPPSTTAPSSVPATNTSTGSAQVQTVLPGPQNGIPEPLGLGAFPGEFVPFGLNHVILIIVPQFKSKYRKLPHWIASSIKVSMPITVFFDQLDVPPGMFMPPGALPLFPPIGAPPLTTLPSAMSPSSSFLVNNTGVPMIHGPVGSNYGYSPYIYSKRYDGDPDDLEVEGYDNYFIDEEDRSVRRRKRDLFLKQETIDTTPVISKRDSHQHRFAIRKKRAISLNRTPHKSERATIMPKIAKILTNAGLEGIACLKRAICETHEAPLKTHYGLVGELITLFFSVSRSIYAESHLPEYVLAEEAGKTGNCVQFHNDCEDTLFSWEEMDHI